MVSTFKGKTGQISVAFQGWMQRTLPGVLSPCYVVAFLSLLYTKSWKRDLCVPFLSQTETAARLLSLLLVDISGAGQSLWLSWRPLSSQSFWLSVTASVTSEQYGPLGILWAYPIHCAWKLQFLQCHSEGPGKKMLVCGKTVSRSWARKQLLDEDKVCLIDETEHEWCACTVEAMALEQLRPETKKGWHKVTLQSQAE